MKNINLYDVLLFIFIFLSVDGLAENQDEQDDLFYEFYPSYYIRLADGNFTQIQELPRDTVIGRDTIYISDIDEFLKQYNCDLKQFVEKYASMKSLTDSINSISDQRLYYNFFLTKDSLKKISNRFIVKEFKVGKTSDYLYRKKELDYVRMGFQDSVRREILFTCEEKTDLFLCNQEAIRWNILAMFSIMQEDKKGIDGINLYFSDFTFQKKREMTQFVKSVRIMMDASKNFKFPDTRLTVIFKNSDDWKKTDRAFQYSLLQEASEIVLLDPDDIIENYAVRGTRLSCNSLKEISILSQIKAHFYIARFNIDTLDITTQNLTEFKGDLFKQILTSDYKENEWETYLFILTGILILIGFFLILYYAYSPFSSFINANIEYSFFIAIIVVFEIIALVVCLFQYMCREDSFSIVDDNPLLVFSLPLGLVFLIPFLLLFKRRRRIP